MKPHEGMRAGLAGGTAVWLWVFVSDWIARAPLKTPAMLGHGLLTIGAPPNAHVSTWESVLAFTVAHFATWIGIGGLMAIAVRAATRTASVLLFALIITVLVQFLIVGITAIMSNGPLGGMAWRDVLIGNFIGWGTASWYLIRRHKELRLELTAASAADET